MQKIVVAVDFSHETDLIVQKAIQVAKAFSSVIYLVHVEPPIKDISAPEAGEDIDEIATKYHDKTDELNALAQQLRDQDIETHAIFITGIPAQSILDEAKNIGADLIVMGTHGHGVVASLLLGGMSQAVVKHSQCPVLLVPTRAQADKS